MPKTGFPWRAAMAGAWLANGWRIAGEWLANGILAGEWLANSRRMAGERDFVKGFSYYTTRKILKQVWGTLRNTAIPRKVSFPRSWWAPACCRLGLGGGGRGEEQDGPTARAGDAAYGPGPGPGAGARGGPKAQGRGPEARGPRPAARGRGPGTRARGPGARASKGNQDFASSGNQASNKNQD